MKKSAISMAVIFVMLILCAVLHAQEQKAGQPLVFPKDQVQEHPSDIHMGSDPYYKKQKKKYEGSDEAGYPREYDPNVEYREQTTTEKKTGSEEPQP